MLLTSLEHRDLEGNKIERIDEHSVLVKTEQL